MTTALVPTLIGFLVSLLTGGIKMIPGFKAAPWHSAAVRLLAAVLAVGIAAGMAYSQGHLAAFDWATVLPVIGDAVAGLLAAFGLYHLATPAK